MIEKFSDKLLSFLLKSEAVDIDEAEYYRYGIEITLSSILNLFLILTIGLISGKLVESIVFLCLFILIRQFSGGFHASTYFWCNATLCTIFILILFLYDLTLNKISTVPFIVVSMICVGVIAIRCPIENKNKPIPRERRGFHKLIATLLGLAYGILSAILIYFDDCLGIIVFYTLCAVTILILAASIQEWRCKYEKAK